MRKESIILITVLMAMINSPLQAANVRYNITDLGTLDGYEHSLAYSINNNGQVVGYAFGDYSTFRALLFDSTGGGNNIDLGTLGGEDSSAASINNNGKIVGWADKEADPMSPYATLFDANGQGNNLVLCDESMAWTNNDAGQIAGLVVFDPNDGSTPIEHAALFSTNYEANHIDLGTLAGFDGSWVLSINNEGQIVGFSFLSTMLYDYSRATLFDSNGTGNNIDLGTLGGDYSKAFSINNHGDIVGVSENALGQERATLFSATGDGNNVDLGTVTGQKMSCALSINDNGGIVGVYYVESSGGENRAMIFDPTGGGNNIDLHDLINPVLGWILQSAVCINNNGWIIGSGTNPDGYLRGFVLTPATAGDFEPDRDVDAEDFAVLAAAWRSTPGAVNWNRFCDISELCDDVIDEKDLKVFTENWLSDI